jgi:hypothetical protein
MQCVAQVSHDYKHKRKSSGSNDKKEQHYPKALLCSFIDVCQAAGHAFAYFITIGANGKLARPFLDLPMIL